MMWPIWWGRSGNGAARNMVQNIPIDLMTGARMKKATIHGYSGEVPGIVLTRQAFAAAASATGTIPGTGSTTGDFVASEPLLFRNLEPCPLFLVFCPGEQVAWGWEGYLREQSSQPTPRSGSQKMVFGGWMLDAGCWLLVAGGLPPFRFLRITQYVLRITHYALRITHYAVDHEGR